jgi:hypothetical protein
MVLELYGKKARLRLMALMYSGIWEAYLIDAPIAIRADNPMEVHPDERKWLTSNEHRRINSGERYSC